MLKIVKNSLKIFVACFLSFLILFYPLLGCANLIGQDRRDVGPGLRDLNHASGFVIGVYEVTGTLKVYHFWFSSGMPGVDKTSNTVCSALPKPIEVFEETGQHVGVKGDSYPGMYNDIPQGMVYRYRDKDGDIFVNSEGILLTRSLIHGTVCKRVLSKKFYETTIAFGPTNLVEGVGGNGEPYFEISLDGAVRLMKNYMNWANVPFGLLAVHDVEITQRKRRGLLRTRITYYFWEKPSYYVIARDLNFGTYLGNGYYLLPEGRFNDLIKNRNLLATRTVSRWTWLARLLFAGIFAVIPGGYFASLPAAGIGGIGKFVADVLFPSRPAYVGNNPGYKALRNIIRNNNEDTSNLSGFAETRETKESKAQTKRSPAGYR